MFARKVQSVIWMDRAYQARGMDARRQFEALYIFPDGFTSSDEAADTVKTLGFDRHSFLYLSFCGMWYAVHINSYYNHAVLAKEKAYYTTERFGVVHTADITSVSPATTAAEGEPLQDNKKWQDGICRDLQMLDADISLADAGGRRIPESRILWNNALVSFGVNFFVREIKIATDKYVEQVFSNYYSDRSLSYEYEKVRELRNCGCMYYNPFLKTTSRTESEKKKKEKALLKGLSIPPAPSREEAAPGIKPMREREVHPCRIYGSSDRGFWKRY